MTTVVQLVEQKGLALRFWADETQSRPCHGPNGTTTVPVYGLQPPRRTRSNTELTATHTSFATFDGSCPVCLLMVESLSRFADIGVRELLEQGCDTAIERLGKQHIRVHAKLAPQSGLMQQAVSFEFTKNPRRGASMTLPKYDAWAAISADPLSAKNVRLALGWIEDCVKGHSSEDRGTKVGLFRSAFGGSKTCQLYRAQRLPRRVIEVPSFGETVRLREGLSEKEDYVALSYCWGASQSMTTTTQTLESRKAGMSLQSLPKTIRDAVIVCKKLNIRYLWVDSLCILQDSVEDWARESARMGEIYSQALLVLAADVAAHSNSGFLGLKSTRHLEFVGFSGQKVDKSGVFASLSRSPKVRCAVVRSGGQDKSRLSTRGWAFQEHYLAPRKLIFAADEIGWECNTHMRCECSTGTGSRYSFTSTLWSDWKMIVEGYTVRQLTNTSDRLPALSGVAARYHAANEKQDEYVCGLWRADLVNLLLWYVPKPCEPNATSLRHSSYQAPSWSWASVTGPIVYYHRGIEDITERLPRVLDVRYDLCSENTYGPVSSAELTLKMHSCQLIFTRDGKNRLVMVLCHSSCDPTGLLGYTPNYRASSSLVHRKEMETRAEPHLGYLGTLVPRWNESTGTEYWVLPTGFVPDIFQEGHESEISFREPCYFGLIMKTQTLFVGIVFRNVADGGNTVRRIGLCIANSNLSAEPGETNARFFPLCEFLDRTLEERSFTAI